MRKFYEDLIKVIALGLFLGLVSIIGIMQVQKHVYLAQEQLRIEALENKLATEEKLELYKTIKNLIKNDLIIAEVIQLLDKKIDTVPNKIKINKIKLEQNLKQISIMVRNKTASALGSGVSIKYKGKFYILTAGHMADNPTDELYLYENDNEICKLEVVKKDYNGTISDTTENDLLLLQPVNKNIQPRFYTELAEIEPVTGTQVYIVGNPMGIEDAISDGRTIAYKDNFMYYLGYTYFGNSGGGVYNYDGKLVGIVSHMYNLKPESIPDAPDYIVNGAVRLETILKFMEGVN